MAELTAIPPPRGEVIHLHDPDYRPAKKTRSIQSSAALCGSLVNSVYLPGVALRKALKWTCREPSAEDPRPPWRWCRSCVGHAVLALDLADSVLPMVVDRLDAGYPLPGSPAAASVAPGG